MVTLTRSVTLAFLAVLVSSVPGHAQCDTTTTTTTTTTSSTVPCTAGEKCGTSGLCDCIGQGGLCGPDTICASNSGFGCDHGNQDCPPGDVCLVIFMGDHCAGRCFTPCP
jgi:hypothetical protein